MQSQTVEKEISLGLEQGFKAQPSFYKKCRTSFFEPIFKSLPFSIKKIRRPAKSGRERSTFSIEIEWYDREIAIHPSCYITSFQAQVCAASTIPRLSLYKGAARLIYQSWPLWLWLDSMDSNSNSRKIQISKPGSPVPDPDPLTQIQEGTIEKKTAEVTRTSPIIRPQRPKTNPRLWQEWRLLCQMRS